MRVYAVADIHGKIDRIEAVRTVIRKESPDLLVIAGDMCRFLSPNNILTRLTGLDIPIFCVRGNSDPGRLTDLIGNHRQMTLLDPEPIQFEGMRFAGLNGTIPLPFVSKVGLNESRLFRETARYMTPNTILVVHPPPRGIRDRVGGRFSAGSFHLRQFVEKHTPLMVLCGHIHEQAGFQYLNRTLVVNCAMNRQYLGAIIDCDAKGLSGVTMVENENIRKRIQISANT